MRSQGDLEFHYSMVIFQVLLITTYILIYSGYRAMAQ